MGKYTNFYGTFWKQLSSNFIWSCIFIKLPFSSLLDKVPNLVFGCIMQKIMVWNYNHWCKQTLWQKINIFWTYLLLLTDMTFSSVKKNIMQGHFYPFKTNSYRTKLFREDIFLKWQIFVKLNNFTSEKKYLIFKQC